MKGDVDLQEYYAGCWMWRKSGMRDELEPELERRLAEAPDQWRIKERKSV